ncbi:MAG: hypothetical protein E7Z90_07010 [Cyanobacteria bacterium SIG29]|nr:hypothetical protein [Cyanobacteria bacterium SIG29]
MRISKIQENISINNKYQAQNCQNKYTNQSNNQTYSQIPTNFKYNNIIHFSGLSHRIEPNFVQNIVIGGSKQDTCLIDDVDADIYKKMSDTRKARYRKIFQNFYSDSRINRSEMFDRKNVCLPLNNEYTLEKFIQASKMYLRYKDHQILCLGRSPKWFLDCAVEMKDGLPPYKFVPFSKYWFQKNPRTGLKRLNDMAPTLEEEAAFKKYLLHKRLDPESIVKNMQETGKETIITDYICTGKGVCSFLDLMGRFAEEQGVLEEFSKSIKIVGIGSMDYMEELNPYAEEISMPRAPIPDILKPYENNIKQIFHNLEYGMFSDMLLNQNTNECRSTYWPHDAWTVYNPDRFRTGMVNTSQIKKLAEKFDGKEKYYTSYTPAMRDYRNLVRFRILDGLNERGLLK